MALLLVEIMSELDLYCVSFRDQLFFFLTFGCRQERILSLVLGSGLKAHLFCSIGLFHASCKK